MKEEELKKSLYNDLEAITKSITVIQECIKVIDYLLQDERDKYKTEVKSSDFFTFTRDNLWKVTVIELANLLNPNTQKGKYESYNLKNTLSELQNGKFSSVDFPKQRIKEWLHWLKSENKVIQNLKDMRNKEFSHNEKYVQIENRVSTSKVWQLLKKIKEIVRELFSSLFNTDYIIDKPIENISEDLKSIIKTLSLNLKTERTLKVRKPKLKIK